MISRRNYFTITAVMLVVFFMFQFTNAVLEGWSGYEENSYAQSRESLLSQSSAYGQDMGEAAGSSVNSRDKVVYIGKPEGALGKVVHNWAVYTKRESEAYRALEEYKRDDTLPGMLVVDAANLDWENETTCGLLKEYAGQGVNLVFCNLPDVSVIKKNQTLMQLLGIKKIRKEQTTVEGLHLYEGFLLGGEVFYRTDDEEESEKKQDMELTFPWYFLSKNTKVYMCGVPEEEMDASDYPPVIWKKNFEDAQIFAVNGDYMDDATGLGLLSAMSAEIKDYELYPVVNAQNMVITNCPGMAPENEKEMEEQYGQSMPELMRNIIWPSVVSVYRRSTLGLSCMVAPQYDYGDDNFPSETEFEFYMKRLKEQSAEAGLSGESISDTPIRQKLEEDERFVKKTLPDYEFSSFYAGDLTESELDSVLQEDVLKKVRTVARDYDGGSEVIGYQSEYITNQNILSDGVEYTFREDFRMRSVQTALGYSSARMDIGSGLYSGSGADDDIDKMISDFSWNVRNYWENFSGFSGTTLSESDQRVRNFLALDYKESREGNIIRLEYTGTQAPVWFILRTEGERIKRMEGGEWKLLEEGVYLIETDHTQVTIEL